MRTAAREPGVDDRQDRKCSDPVIRRYLTDIGLDYGVVRAQK